MIIKDEFSERAYGTGMYCRNSDKNRMLFASVAFEPGADPV